MKKLKLLELLVVGCGFLLCLNNPGVSEIKAGQIVIEVSLTLLIESLLKQEDTKIYRTEDAGLWTCLMLPAIIQMKHHYFLAVCKCNKSDCLDWHVKDCLKCTTCILLSAAILVASGLVSLLTPLSLLVYVRQINQQGTSLVLSAGLLLYLTTLCALHHVQISGVVCGSGMVYCFLLWYLPRQFPQSFTFGEVSMVTQLIIYFIYKCFTWLLDTKVDGTTEAVDILTGAVYVGVLVVMMILAQYRRLGLAGVTSLVVMAVVICISVILYLIGWSNIFSIVKSLLLSQISLLLLSWWLVCTLASLYLVTKYGDHSPRHQLSTPDLYDKHSTDQTLIKKTQTSLRNKPNVKDKSKMMITNLKGENKLVKEQMQHDKTTKKKCSMKSNVEDENCLKAGQKNTEKCFIHTISDPLQNENSREKIHTSSTPSLSESKTRKLTVPGTQNERCRVPAYVRKYFHGAVLCVYVPGLLYHPQLLYVASTVAVGVMVVVEGIRVADVSPISPILSQYLKVFLDQQDHGDLILTPIYLLMGCSLPLWLNHLKQSCLSLYAGLISVGVGDSLASLVGRTYGHHKWPGSQKSYEGSIAAFIGQLLVIVLLHQLGVMGSSLHWPIVVSMLLSVCLEACSTQIDNLVVPVFTYMMLAATETQATQPTV